MTLSPHTHFTSPLPSTQGTLQTGQLYPSDVCLVNSEGYTLLMLAAQHNHEALLRDLLKMDRCPLDYRHMMVCVCVCCVCMCVCCVCVCVHKRGNYMLFPSQSHLPPPPPSLSLPPTQSHLPPPPSYPHNLTAQPLQWERLQSLP